MVEQDLRRRAEPYVGLEAAPHEFELTDEHLRHYFEGLALEPPPASNGLPEAPSMLASVPDSVFTASTGYSNAFGNLWLRQEWELREPLRLGERHRATARVIDIYERRDRSVVNTEMTIADSGGAAAVLARHHQSYVLHQSAGEVALRDPGSKEGGRRFEVPEGEPMEPLTRTITLEMCGTFFHGRSSYHTDRQASEALGFRDVVVGGRMTMSYLGHLLERRFGLPWWTSGRMDVKFTNIVWPGDEVTARAVVTGPLPDDPSRTGAFAWLEKQDGTVAVVATASMAT
jgi:acyl dehydratase